MSEVKNVLHVENATMQFGGVVAVDNLNLDVNEGEIVALIGPNGAGNRRTSPPGCRTRAYSSRDSTIPSCRKARPASAYRYRQAIPPTSWIVASQPSPRSAKN